ncbi:polyprenyl diphosphate synthase [Stackebrandtia soli]|uniref:polyprenyl diphosphate synthase n=1 Tax=Stackebrandtia soli TaxID=1892856 RepID=UPI0039EB7D1A
MWIPGWVYRVYGAAVTRRLDAERLPEHVALVMDGNRRWAREAGYDNPSEGHRRGAEHVEEVLGWCERIGVRHVTVYVASSDNIRKRGGEEVDFLMRMIEEVVTTRLTRQGNPWRLHLAGRLDALPDSTKHALKTARDATADRDRQNVTIAIGYDGHEEIADAVRSLIEAETAAGTDIDELAQRLTPADIAAHIQTGQQPPPDLIIRTSGERRLSSFLLWQSIHSELYFCDVYWPAFRHVDFLRALRSFAQRRRE